MLGIFNYFSKNISQILNNFFEGQLVQKQDFLEEIRIRSNGTIALKLSHEQVVLRDKITYEDILKSIQIMCDNSIYSYQNEICNGYITVKGGHRVGITGNCVIENGRVININYISSINFRISRQVLGCSDKALQYILKIGENSIYNTMIVSSPGVRENNIVKRLDKKYKYRNRSYKF